MKSKAAFVSLIRSRISLRFKYHSDRIRTRDLLVEERMRYHYANIAAQWKSFCLKKSANVVTNVIEIEGLLFLGSKRSTKEPVLPIKRRHAHEHAQTFSTKELHFERAHDVT